MLVQSNSFVKRIAAKAGITAGAIYKHFSGKEEMFEEIFNASGKRLMSITEDMMGMDFSVLSDEDLIKILYSRVSLQAFELLQEDMKLFHMLLKNDSGTYIERFRAKGGREGHSYAHQGRASVSSLIVP